MRNCGELLAWPCFFLPTLGSERRFRRDKVSPKAEGPRKFLVIIVLPQYTVIGKTDSGFTRNVGAFNKDHSLETSHGEDPEPQEEEAPSNPVRRYSWHVSLLFPPCKSLFLKSHP